MYKIFTNPSGKTTNNIEKVEDKQFMLYILHDFFTWSTVYLDFKNLGFEFNLGVSLFGNTFSF